MIMKRNSLAASKIGLVLATIGLLTACGATGTTGTANTSDYDADTMISTNIQDLGTEEYLLTENDSVATDEEKQEKYIHYLEGVLADDIAKAFPSVKDADVALVGTDEIVQVNICLDLEEELAEDSIVTIAEAVATATDSATDNITIQDAEGKILYIRSEALPENEI